MYAMHEGLSHHYSSCSISRLMLHDAQPIPFSHDAATKLAKCISIYLHILSLLFG